MKILFVCLGNICRSPAAEGILRHLAEKEQYKDVEVRSCGIGSWHIGNLPDARMQEAAKRRGVVLSMRAQQFLLSYFDEYDYLFAADHDVLKVLYQYATTAEQKSKLHLMTAFSESYRDHEIPDPYYSGEAGFEHILDMLEDACQGILEQIRNT